LIDLALSPDAELFMNNDLFLATKDYRGFPDKFMKVYVVHAIRLGSSLN
jgi:hypothetical protein